MRNLIPYKQASDEVKKAVKRKRLQFYPQFWKRIFIRLSKCFLEYNGIQSGFGIYFDQHLWTIVYNKDRNHRFNTTFSITIPPLPPVHPNCKCIHDINVKK